MFDDHSKEDDLGLGFLSMADPGVKLQPLDDYHQLPPKSNSRGRPKGQKNNAKRKEGKKRADPSTDRNIGHWSYDENKRYHWFLELYNHHFINKHLRRTDKIFKTMEIFLGTREAEQCRSHHQKMEKKHKTFQQILLYLRNHFYGTESADAVIDDLAKNNIALIDTIVKGESLHREPEYAAKDHGVLGGELVIMPMHEESKVENIFSEKYENHMELRNLIG